MSEENDEPFERCQQCRTPILDDAIAVVVYFRTEADKQEFTEVVRQACPNMTTYDV